MSIPSSKEKITGAFLAAAVGDALGWPYEDRSRNLTGRSATEKNGYSTSFSDWTRRVGSRFQTVLEPIRAGEYSDDTQLILCTARSVLRSSDWWDYFTHIELPLWLLYERGGGGATKRAAEAWLAGKTPWELKKMSTRYFQAGGNGVCMRILPHVIRHIQSEDFQNIATDIFLNGISTHGHPRALIGALGHGFVLWSTFRQTSFLEYGDLIKRSTEMISSWAELPLAASEQESWRRSFTNDAFRSYRSIWQESVQEMRRLLGIAIEGVKDGALSTGYETLRMMGAFDRKISGSGTISAAASMFLASRYAVSPLQGLRVAATATGADTDTLASMTASILGALNGDEWIAPFREQSQDADYLVAIANAFDSNLQQKSTLGHSAQRISKRTTAAFLEALEKLTTPTPITLLDGRRAMLIAKEELPCTGKTYRAWRWRLETQDGQTIFIKKTRRRSAKDIPPLLETRIEVVRLGLKIFVDDLAKAKEFYTSLLGLPLDKETASAFTVNGILSVQRSNNRAFRTFERPQDGTCGPLLCLRVTNLQEAYRMLSARGVKIVEELRQQKSYCSFRVADPSGNLVEIFESTSSATPAPC